MCHALDTDGEISKLLKYSPRRYTLFKKLKMDLAPAVPSFRILCPTRWTVKAVSLQSVIDNYSVFQELWVEAMDITKDSEARSSMCGVEAQMTKFEFLLGVLLGVCILRHTDNLSKTLQTPRLSASDGQNVAELTCKTLDKMHTDDYFQLFWANALRYQYEFGVNEPELPRKRKAPRRFEVGTGESSFSTTPEDLYCQKYMEAIDLVVNFIRNRFDQPGYKIYCNLENLLSKQKTTLLRSNLSLSFMGVTLMVLFFLLNLNFLQPVLLVVSIMISLHYLISRLTCAIFQQQFNAACQKFLTF